jgi:hypothetical protein
LVLLPELKVGTDTCCHDEVPVMITDERLLAHALSTTSRRSLPVPLTQTLAA